MKSLQTALGRLLMPAGPSRPTDPVRQAERQARTLAKRFGAELGLCFDRLRGAGINVWPPAGLRNDPYEGDHYAQSWTEALQHVQGYIAASWPTIPTCLQRLQPHVRAWLNDSLCNDESSTDEEMQAHWRAEFGLTIEQAAAAIAYRPRCLVEVFFGPFEETLDIVTLPKAAPRRAR